MGRAGIATSDLKIVVHEGSGLLLISTEVYVGVTLCVRNRKSSAHRLRLVMFGRYVAMAKDCEHVRNSSGHTEREGEKNAATETIGCFAIVCCGHVGGCDRQKQTRHENTVIIRAPNVGSFGRRRLRCASRQFYVEKGDSESISALSGIQHFGHSGTAWNQSHGCANAALINKVAAEARRRPV